MATSPKSSGPGKSAEPLRYAHPFFSAGKDPAKRAPQGKFGQRMLDHIAKNLDPIPKVKSTGPMSLAAIIGATAAAEIDKAGKISFHVGGDSGVPDVLDRETRQVMVADAMSGDFRSSHSTAIATAKPSAT